MTGVQTCALPICFPVTIKVAKVIADVSEDLPSLLELAEEAAGTRGAQEQNTQIEQMSKIASKFAEEGTEQHTKLMSALTSLIAQPLFQDAVKVLDQGKVSVGRDVAGLFGLDPDSAAYRWVSGGIDAATVIAIDPFLLAGKVSKVWQVARRGMNYADATVAANRYREIAELPEMVRLHDVVAKSVNAGDIRIFS